MQIEIGSYYKLNTKPEIAFIILEEIGQVYVIKSYFKTGDSIGTFEKKGLKRMISKGVLQKISEEEAVAIAL